MTNEQGKAELAGLLDEFQAQIHAIAEINRRRTELMASGTAGHKRVTVTVNANGVVIETKFSEDILDLEPYEIAQAVTEAAQAAAAEMARKNEELMAPLRDSRARIPKMSDLIVGLPDVEDLVPEPLPISTAPPGSPERLRDTNEDERFTDVEYIDLNSRSNIAAPEW
ncbi:YbaB/EbfC family nucleoid-associated protein [Nocardia sp. CDC153]|uniref:YbaB/EbfC family nucleoid-associated protein n=1 Tax=Nocardia sp. CDC153 TaxID=3112167 RepID=UPI002DBF112C|nr:YbaB/EbfC family nucleoid-associated protein [Nocardia sp. CDC153]MEC3952996.1 YbaB/EbfC family nucleoid-associated protein [Nocardia sp. CDC153]